VPNARAHLSIEPFEMNPADENRINIIVNREAQIWVAAIEKTKISSSTAAAELAL
jgi:hypothetical protein